MGLDQTQVLWEAAQALVLASGADQERLAKLRAAHVLRSYAARSDFTDAALQVAKNVDALTTYVQQNRRAYVQPGKLSEAERDSIEAQVGDFLRTCKQNITCLQSTASPEGPDLSSQDMSAHRLGAVLLLSERLQHVGMGFDRARAVRYQQKQQQQQELQRRQQIIRLAPVKRYTPAQNGYSPGSSPWQGDAPQDDSSLHETSEQQQAYEAESAALMAEVESTGQAAFQAESTMRELATLNQMFSTQIVQQAEQIQLLYEQAVDSLSSLDRGNVHLGKAIKHNTSARYYVLYTMIIASLCLLFADWYAS